MTSRRVTIVLAIALLISIIGWLPGAAGYRLGGHNRGYEPDQPIAFSHRLHSAELQVGCAYCHWAAEKSRYAGIPAASICMNCHRSVSAPFSSIRAEEEQARREQREARPIVSAEIKKIYEHLGLGDDMERDPAKQPRPIEWALVHAIPDYVYFDHRAHVGVGVACQQCHGPVETMERVRQTETLSMGWCVNCHRDATRDGVAGRTVNASIDCSTCHR